MRNIFVICHRWNVIGLIFAEVKVLLSDWRRVRVELRKDQL
jgi:hypothetical protein